MAVKRKTLKNSKCAPIPLKDATKTYATVPSTTLLSMRLARAFCPTAATKATLSRGAMPAVNSAKACVMAVHGDNYIWRCLSIVCQRVS